MFRFIHSADWQLGARFAQFGARAGRLREARLATLRRALTLGRERTVDAFLIAGDLFDDNQVDDALVTATIELFREFAHVPVFILPGNHDPYTGPDSVWRRKPFLNGPANVRVLLEAGSVDLGEAVLLASPLHQKLSTLDPSLRLVELAHSVPAGKIKLGLTHGALAIEGRHSPNDFPIALNAASRAGLDYLGIGHWHNWLVDTDGGRIVMPGTPEPDQFGNERSGQVAFVELAGPGVLPHVEPLAVATLAWRTLAFDFLSEEASKASIDAALAELRPTSDRTVLRVTLTGTTSPARLGSVRSWLDASLAGFLVGQVADRTRIALTGPELADLKTRHPLLAQTLADIDRLEALATGTTPPGESFASLADTAPAPLSLAEVQTLLGPSKIDLANLTPEFFSQLRQILLQTLQEVAA